jgi:5'-nucleotidase/UDP-sugar diphosphatase
MHSMCKLKSKPLLLLFLVMPVLLPLHWAEAAIDLTILHMNDTHGRILPYVEKSVSQEVPVSGAAYYSKVIETERAGNPEGTLLLSAGDMFQGTPVSNLFRGKPMIEVMNALKFDAMAMGNHEFDWGPDALRELVSSAQFPFLCANITDENFSYFPGTRPYVLLTRKDVTIGIIGLTTPETRYTTKPSHVSNLIFLDPAEVASRMIEAVKQQGAQLVVVLSHLGLDGDIELAARAPGIDIIVGGHSHTAVTSPVKVGQTIIVQAGYYGIYVGALKVRVDPESSNKIVDYSQKEVLRTVFAGPKDPFDPEVLRMVRVYDDQVKTEFARVVGQTRVDLMREPYQESNIGNSISDALLESSGTQIAFQNSGGIRADLLKGPIPMEGVYTVLPFDNVLVAMDLTGRQILELLEKSARLEQRILQVSGMRVTYDMARPAGSRVARALVKTGASPEGMEKQQPANPAQETGGQAGAANPEPDLPLGYEPLQPEKTYRVVTNDFLAAGGDNFTTFKEGRNPAYGDTIRDAYLEYLKKYSPIEPRVEDRLIFLNR